MRKAMAAVAAAGPLLALFAAASPALAVQGDTQLALPPLGGGPVPGGGAIKGSRRAS